MRRLRAHARDERGVALVIVLVALVIAGLLAAAVIAAAVQSNDTTIRGGHLNAAVAAADSGLDVATYRINMLEPSSTNCVTTAVVAPTGTQCPEDGPESLGNGATYEFWSSPVMTGGTCAGLNVDSTQGSIAQRCLTAIGTVNGVSARVEARVAAFTATPLFPTALLGLSSVTIGNNATIGSQAVPATVGTNGQLTVGGGTTTMTGYELGPNAPAPIVGNGATTGPATTRNPAQGPFVLSPVNPGNSATVNDNSRITTGLDPSSKVSFNATSRVLSIGTNGSLTLSGATYNFCNFTAANNATITIANGAKVEIFIDSPDDPNSGCTAASGGYGNFTMSQNDSFVNYGGNYKPGTGDATAAQIYVYGLDNDTNTVSFFNNTNTYVSLYAPQSNVVVSPSANTAFTGAIAGYTVTIGNKANFQFDGEDGYLTAGTTGLYYRTAWEQCPPTPTSSTDPTSGC